ncbi:MAG: 2,3-bisphosphoglycerate-independent phosphoglycerate mutase, partial [Pseudonocardiales bacterium]|nr:2,3-bisphosphoglycerate-independent phosphoglycerate mutase [Pseudonocardiales bacterium]
MNWADGPGPLPVPKAVLVILDGWGIAPDGPGNAVSQANTPVFDELWRSHQTTQLTACGR